MHHVCLQLVFMTWNARHAVKSWKQKTLPVLNLYVSQVSLEALRGIGSHTIFIILPQPAVAGSLAFPISRIPATVSGRPLKISGVSS